MTSLTGGSSAEVIPFQPRPSKYYLRLTDNLLRSTAWESLSANERALYVDIASKFNGYNNGRIAYSIRGGAKALRIGHHTVCRALKRLQELRLLVRTKHGHFDPGTGRAKDSEWYVPDCGGPSEAVATTGKCLGSSGHHKSEAVATTEPKYIDKEVDKNKNLGLPREKESEAEKRKRSRKKEAKQKKGSAGLPKASRSLPASRKKHRLTAARLGGRHEPPDIVVCRRLSPQDNRTRE